MSEPIIDFGSISALQQVKIYKTVYALTDIKRGGNKLQASHIVACLESGRYPLWGVFSTKTGKLIAQYGSKDYVARAYPGKIFRRLQLSFQSGDLMEALTREEREKDLRQQVKDEVAKTLKIAQETHQTM